MPISSYEVLAETSLNQSHIPYRDVKKTFILPKCQRTGLHIPITDSQPVNLPSVLSLQPSSVLPFFRLTAFIPLPHPVASLLCPPAANDFRSKSRRSARLEWSPYSFVRVMEGRGEAGRVHRKSDKKSRRHKILSSFPFSTFTASYLPLLSLPHPHLLSPLPYLLAFSLTVISQPTSSLASSALVISAVLL